MARENWKNSDCITVMEHGEVLNKSGRWVKVTVVRVICGATSFASFGFIIPQMIAEGGGFTTPERAMARAMGIVVGLVVGVICAIV